MYPHVEPRRGVADTNKLPKGTNKTPKINKYLKKMQYPVRKHLPRRVKCAVFFENVWHAHCHAMPIFDIMYPHVEPRRGVADTNKLPKGTNKTKKINKYF